MAILGKSYAEMLRELKIKEPVEQAVQAVKTYALLTSERTGQDQIMCLRCGRVSHNPNDIANKYCGHCHMFH